MSKLVIKHTEIGEIKGYRYEANEDYTPGDGELVPSENVNHRELNRYRVESGELVEIQDYEPTPDDDLETWANQVQENEPVSRQKVSEDSQKQFKEAFENENTQECLRLIWEVLTGVDVK